MTDKPGPPLLDPRDRSRPSAFTFAHLLGFLFCWFPANPFVLHYFSQLFRTDFKVTLPGWSESIWYLKPTVFGPFTVSLEGRNRPFCLEIAVQALPICLGALVFATMVQIVWRPRTVAGSAFRLVLWMMSWFLWFGGAIYSVLSNSS